MSDNKPEIEVLRCDGEDTCCGYFYTIEGFSIGDPCHVEGCDGVLREATFDELYNLRYPD